MAYKTLFTIFVVSTFSASAAFALQPPRVLGEHLVSGGGPLPPTVKPSSFKCTVTETDTHRIVYEGNQITKNTSVPTKYDANVKNAADFFALVQTATTGKLVKRIGPTDVPTRSYAAYDNAMKKVVLGSFGPSIVTNDSPAARTLTDFIQHNCYDGTR